MPTIKNSQTSRYCHFNKIIKWPGTSFQSPALNQKHFRNVCHTAHQYLTKFDFDSFWNSQKKPQKSRYLENETFFLQIKNSLITHQGQHYGKKIVM